MSIYDFTVVRADGSDVSLSEYEGKILLVVNTATGCGLTPQYTGLQSLYDKYKERGFEILDFPCNQFMNQSPGTDEEIGSFCTLNYGTTFPRFKKIEVNGANASPLYVWLKSQKSGKLGSEIKWNFAKFLVGANGEVIKRYAPTTKPEAIGKDIEKLTGGA
ncbi:MAG: glutathione peroxidase [Oscillospiraceae bacterium]|nr:glutathione peroxidase [Oscillospiraceae bacterium]